MILIVSLAVRMPADVFLVYAQAMTLYDGINVSQVRAWLQCLDCVFSVLLWYGNWGTAIAIRCLSH